MDTIKQIGLVLLRKPKTVTLIVSAVVWAGAKFGFEMSDEAALGMASPLVAFVVALLAKEKVDAKKAEPKK